MKQAGIAGRTLLGLMIFLMLVSGAVAQTWTLTGSMSEKRSGLTATLLSNGQVLVTGGNNGSTILNSAELYNPLTPLTGTFTPTGNMNIARGGHTATLLLNSPLSGQVLIVGGESNSNIVASAELYDPVNGMFTFTGNMATTRSQHAAVLLQNGKVLVLGGENNSHGALDTAELYDPATHTFTPTANNMTTTRREFPRATRLNDGRVLVTGGELFNNGPILASAEIYDPTTNMFTATGNMTVARVSHTATLLLDGQVLITGGHSGPHDSPVGRDTAELYDPVNGTFTAIINHMTSIRVEHGATSLSTNQVLLAGGTDLINRLKSAEIYNPTTQTFTSTASMNDARGVFALVFLNGGTVLAAGGSGANGPLASAELYSPSTEKLTSLSPAILWVGLKNSDDQGTQFDLRAEVYIEDALVASGETLCVISITRNPAQAKQVSVTFGSISDGAFESGDTLSLKILTRIGTNQNGTKCAGPGGSHNNAVGLRLYYDATNRASGFGATLTPNPSKTFYLHSNTNNVDFFDETPPGATTAKFKDSAAVNFAGGNLWQAIGTWSMTLP